MQNKSELLTKTRRFRDNYRLKCPGGCDLIFRGTAKNGRCCHFAHKMKECSYIVKYSDDKGGGGESTEHLDSKLHFNKVKHIHRKCRNVNCDLNSTTITIDYSDWVFKTEYKLDKWLIDVAFVDKNNNLKLLIEICHTHYTDGNKRDYLKKLNVPYFEIKTSEIIQNHELVLEPFGPPSQPKINQSVVADDCNFTDEIPICEKCKQEEEIAKMEDEEKYMKFLKQCHEYVDICEEYNLTSDLLHPNKIPTEILKEFIENFDNINIDFLSSDHQKCIKNIKEEVYSFLKKSSKYKQYYDDLWSKYHNHKTKYLQLKQSTFNRLFQYLTLDEQNLFKNKLNDLRQKIQQQVNKKYEQLHEEFIDNCKKFDNLSNSSPINEVSYTQIFSNLCKNIEDLEEEYDLLTEQHFKNNKKEIHRFLQKSIKRDAAIAAYTASKIARNCIDDPDIKNIIEQNINIFGIKKKEELMKQLLTTPVTLENITDICNNLQKYEDILHKYGTTDDYSQITNIIESIQDFRIPIPKLEKIKDRFMSMLFSLFERAHRPSL